MKMAFQTILLVTMFIASGFWFLATQKPMLMLGLHPPAPNMTDLQWWEYIDNPMIAQATYADDIFWLCLCLFIITWNTK